MEIYPRATNNFSQAPKEPINVRGCFFAESRLMQDEPYDIQDNPSFCALKGDVLDVEKGKLLQTNRCPFERALGGCLDSELGVRTRPWGNRAMSLVIDSAGYELPIIDTNKYS